MNAMKGLREIMPCLESMRPIFSHEDLCYMRTAVAEALPRIIGGKLQEPYAEVSGLAPMDLWDLYRLVRESTEDSTR